MVENPKEPHHSVGIARGLRKAQTKAEEVLWGHHRHVQPALQLVRQAQYAAVPGEENVSPREEVGVEMVPIAPVWPVPAFPVELRVQLVGHLDKVLASEHVSAQGPEAEPRHTPDLLYVQERQIVDLI